MMSAVLAVLLSLRSTQDYSINQPNLSRHTFTFYLLLIFIIHDTTQMTNQFKRSYSNYNILTYQYETSYQTKASPGNFESAVPSNKVTPKYRAQLSKRKSQ